MSALEDRLDDLRARAARTAPVRALARRGIGQDKLAMLLFLSLLHITAAPDLASLAAPAAAVLAGVAVDGAARLIRGERRFPAGAAITGLIVAGIVFPGATVTAAAVTSGSVLLKDLVRWRGRNVFNPAALGLVVAAAAGTSLVWGIAGAPFELLLALGLATAAWAGVHDTAAAFLGAHWLVQAALSPAAVAAAPLAPVDGRPLFFGLVMVVEPVTGPNTRSRRLVYGAGVAVLAALLQLAAPALPGTVSPLFADTLLLALLAGNLAHRLASAVRG